MGVKKPKKYFFRSISLIALFAGVGALVAWAFFPRRVTNASPSVAEGEVIRFKKSLEHNGLYASDGSWRGPRVFLVGVDGLSYDLAADMMNRGKMPNLQKLVREGASGRLKTLSVLISPAIWTTIATGVFPENHGIKTYLLRDEEQNAIVPANSSHRRFPALWEMASEFGLKVVVVSYWASWPAEKINGFLVSNRTRLSLAYMRHFSRGLPDENVVEAEKLTWPPVLYEEIYPFVSVEREISEKKLGKFLKTSSDRILEIERKNLYGLKGPIGNLRTALADDEFTSRTGLHLYSACHPDLFIVYLRGLDRTSHHFWKYREPEKFPRVPEAAVEIAGKVIERYYGYVDQMLGELLGLVGEGDYVMVVSDHGFRAGKPRNRVSGVHKRFSAVYAKGPGITPGTRVEPERFPHSLSIGGCHVVDVTPTVLTWLGLPLAEYFQGGPCEEITAGKKKTPPEIRGYPHRPTKLPHPSMIRKEVEEEKLEKLRDLGYLD